MHQSEWRLHLLMRMRVQRLIIRKSYLGTNLQTVFKKMMNMIGMLSVVVLLRMGWIAMPMT